MITKKERLAAMRNELRIADPAWLAKFNVEREDLQHLFGFLDILRDWDDSLENGGISPERAAENDAKLKARGEAGPQVKRLFNALGARVEMGQAKAAKPAMGIAVPRDDVPRPDRPLEASDAGTGQARPAQGEAIPTQDPPPARGRPRATQPWWLMPAGYQDDLPSAPVADIVCDACFKRLWPHGRDQKTCTHGCNDATCCVCGAVRKPEDRPYFHCLGGLLTEDDRKAIVLAALLRAPKWEFAFDPTAEEKAEALRLLGEPYEVAISARVAIFREKDGSYSARSGGTYTGEIRGATLDLLVTEGRDRLWFRRP